MECCASPRAAQSAGAREQKWYLLPGTNQNVAGTIGKEGEKLKKIMKKIKKIPPTSEFFFSNRCHLHRTVYSPCFRDWIQDSPVSNFEFILLTIY